MYMYGKRKQGQPRMKWREQVEGSMRRIGLKKEDAADRCWCRKAVRRVAEVVGCIQPSSFTVAGHSSHWGLNRIKTGLMMM